METKDFEKFAETVLQQYGVYLEKRLKQSLNRKGIRAGENLYDKIRFEVKSEGFEQILKLYFPDYGRLIDMKRPYQRPAPTSGKGLDELTEWVEKKGIGNFKRVSGYKESAKKVLPAPQSAKRIAKGIAFAMRTKIRRIAWYSTPLFKSFNMLIKSIVSGQAQALLAQQKSIFKEKP